MAKKQKTEEANPGRNLIRFDWAMKRLLRNKADYVVLEGFLTVLLGEKVKITNIGESESNRTDVNDKTNRVDVMVENDAKEIFIIEIQTTKQIDYFYRMLFGVSKAITEHISIGEDYTHVRKVYHINIVYFELGKGEDYVYHGTTSFRGIHRGDELKLTRQQQDFFGRETVLDMYPEYYVLKVKDFDNYAKDNLDQWIYYLKNDAIPDSFTAPGLPEARRRLQVEGLTTSERAAYNAHLMQLSHDYSVIHTARDEGKYEGLKQGRAESEEERRKLQEEIDTQAKNLREKDKTLAQKDEALVQKENIIANAINNLMKQGFSFQQIAQILQLDVEDVKRNIN